MLQQGGVGKGRGEGSRGEEREIHRERKGREGDILGRREKEREIHREREMERNGRK